MKKFILLSVLLMMAGMLFAATVTITNSSFSFSPGDVTINTGDTVVFSLASIHNAVEVSETTWNANGNTPLPGGFSVGFGGGTVTGLLAGTHYYVCSPHASSGMKGKIIVNGPTGILSFTSFQDLFLLYPNPTKGGVKLKYLGNPDEPNGIPSKHQHLNLEITTMEGKQLYSAYDLDLQSELAMDLSMLPAGNYLVRVDLDRKKYTSLLIRE